MKKTQKNHLLEMNEAELIIRVKNGDEKAFRIIVERYQQSIISLCFRYVSNIHDAEEIAQNVFIHLYRAAKSYEPRAKLSTFLYRIAVNLSLNWIRDQKRKRFISWEVLKKERGLDPIAHEYSNPDMLLERKEKQNKIRNAVNSLPRNQRTAVILHRFQGLSYGEIAEVMKCSVSAVEARLYRAKQNLIKRLKPLLKTYNI